VVDQPNVTSTGGPSLRGPQGETIVSLSSERPLVLDRYRLQRRLGSGGFGTVWQAHDVRLDRPVAVKRIPLDGEDNPRAEREALAAARLAHPGIVALYEAGHDDEAWWLVSELVRGHTLADLERAGALSDLDVVRIGLALCGALEHAHARGVIHRDVKPGNVMVPEQVEDGAGLAKLTDFGIAHLADSGALTRTGDVIGTIAYMAPEQAEGGRITGAVDLYALALVLYEALSGTNPVRAASPGQTARRLGMHLPPLAGARRDLPRDLCEAIDVALDPDPAERGDLADLRAVLLDAEHDVGDDPGHVTAEAPTWVDRTLGRLGGPAPPARTWDDESAAWSIPPREPAGAVALDPAGSARRRPRVTPLGRGFAGVAAAGLALWATTELPADLTLGGAFSAPEPVAVAAVVGVAVALLPRLAWLAALAALLVLLGPDRTTAGVLAAAVPVILLVPRHGPLWSLPAAAPALGAIGLAGAHPAIAGQARTLPARAGLGALGLWWLTIGGVITDADPDLGALVEPGLLALAALWGAAAAVLPFVVRGRHGTVDALGAACWAAALAAATPALAEAFSVTAPANAGPAAALGAGFAVAARALRG
jgi:hypothetical protein